MSIILEFKHAKTHEDSAKEAKNALKQIDQLKYHTDLKRYPHIKKVLKVGLAFCEKSVISAYRVEDLEAHVNSDVILSQEYRDPDIYDDADNLQKDDVVATAASSTKKTDNRMLSTHESSTEKKSKHTAKRSRIIESDSGGELQQEKALRTQEIDKKKETGKSTLSLSSFSTQGVFGTRGHEANNSSTAATSVVAANNLDSSTDDNYATVDEDIEQQNTY